MSCKISSGMCSRFRPHLAHLLQSWQMDLSLLGATQYYGGGSFDVQDQLRNVQQVHATGRAFAAILADGSVVTWGNPCDGGDSFDVREQLRNV